VIAERVLLKLFEAGLLRGPMKGLVARRTWRVQTGEASGLKLSFPQNLDFVRGSTELPMQRCVAAHLAPGGVFYDVGANVGFFSLLATRRVGRDGAVYAFEPVAENVEAIRRNLRLNAIDNVSVFQVAIEEKSRPGILYVTKWDGGSSLSTGAVTPAEPVEERRVEVVSLDELVQTKGLRPPTLVKIDVEGAELGVLRGMLKTIERFRPVVVYEVDDGDQVAFVRRWQALDDFVVSVGYRITRLEDSYTNTKWYVGHTLAVPSSTKAG
jgi:FkbM family methyltransferase